MSEKKRVYITVKTYPTISEKYAELVCTAGLLDDGTWIRLYPVPFRLLNDNQKYPKYTWITVDVEKNVSDHRKESYRPDLSTIVAETRHPKIIWEDRRDIILGRGHVYKNLKEIIDKAHSKEMSLATFKPTKILRFTAEKTSREWDRRKLQNLQMQSQQLNLFKTMEEIEDEFRVVEKIPYKFSYEFEDDSGKKAKLMIEDWEIGMLFLNCLKRSNGDEKAAIASVRQKYFGELLKRDLYFFLGTTLRHHFSASPYVIIGVFYPPMPPEDEQLSLF